MIDQSKYKIKINHFALLLSFVLLGVILVSCQNLNTNKNANIKKMKRSLAQEDSSNQILAGSWSGTITGKRARVHKPHFLASLQLLLNNEGEPEMTTDFFRIVTKVAQIPFVATYPSINMEMTSFLNEAYTKEPFEAHLGMRTKIEFPIPPEEAKSKAAGANQIYNTLNGKRLSFNIFEHAYGDEDYQTNKDMIISEARMSGKSTDDIVIPGKIIGKNFVISSSLNNSNMDYYNKSGVEDKDTSDGTPSVGDKLFKELLNLPITPKELIALIFLKKPQAVDNNVQINIDVGGSARKFDANWSCADGQNILTCNVKVPFDYIGNGNLEVFTLNAVIQDVPVDGVPGKTAKLTLIRANPQNNLSNQTLLEIDIKLKQKETPRLISSGETLKYDEYKHVKEYFIPSPLDTQEATDDISKIIPALKNADVQKALGLGEES